MEPGKKEFVEWAEKIALMFHEHVKRLVVERELTKVFECGALMDKHGVTYEEAEKMWSHKQQE